MTVLTDNAELASEINVERARAALQRATEALKTLAPADPAFAETQAAFNELKLVFRSPQAVLTLKKRKSFSAWSRRVTPA